MPLNYLTGIHIDDLFIKYSVGLPMWFVVLGWLITITNIIANSILIFVIKKHFLDNTHYWFTLSLATADLLIGVSIFPSLFICNISNTGPCDWYMQLFIYSSFIYVSVMSVAMTIFDHYVIVAFPLKYATLLTPSRVRKIILCSWIVPLFLGLLPLAWEDLSNNQLLKVTEEYFIGMLVIFEIIPFLGFIWISGHVIKIVKTQRNKIQAQCNVRGRLSPPTFHKRNCNEDIVVRNNNLDMMEISQTQESSNYINKPEISEATTRCSTVNENESNTDINHRPSYLYSLNNWLPSLPRQTSTDTRTSTDLSDFPSSISLSNSKDVTRIQIRQFRDQRHRSVLITCLLVVFLCCYALTLVNANCVFLNYCTGNIDSINFKIITLFFELLNSTLNPLLFMLVGKDLRRKVSKLSCYPWKTNNINDNSTN